ncbi:MAG: hypothetical protein WAM82_19795 [Thermoanaerobaculia bacterium]
MRPLPLLLLASLAVASCTTVYQVRGTESTLKPMPVRDLVGSDDIHRARQISMEHESIEKYDDFSLGVIEISDEGTVNPAQKEMVMDWIERETKPGGILVVFAHGWHHGARTCDNNLCCFRTLLSEMKKSGMAGAGKNVVGLYLGWRGESLPYEGWNIATLWGRKRVAEHAGRTAGKEILLELERRVWGKQWDLSMITIGHSLGGALVYSAIKSKLTGDISDIELGKVRDFRVVRTEDSRVEALERKQKAIRAGFGDLVVLVNPALEASEYRPFDADLRDDRVHCSGSDCHGELLRQGLPYDKLQPYQKWQMPVLLTFATDPDTAVGLAFPPARILQAFFTLHWGQLGKAYWTGMGRYAPQATHRLTAPARYKDEPGTVSADCGCRKVAEGLAAMPPISVQLDSASGAQKIGGGLEFGLTKERLRRGWDVNSPYLVVQTDKGVMSDHNDIFNPTFIAFLRAYIEAYDKKYDSLPEEVKQTMKQ